jgi:hypothetical protein
MKVFTLFSKDLKTFYIQILRILNIGFFGNDQNNQRLTNKYIKQIIECGSREFVSYSTYLFGWQLEKEEMVPFHPCSDYNSCSLLLIENQIHQELSRTAFDEVIDVLKMKATDIDEKKIPRRYKDEILNQFDSSNTFTVLKWENLFKVLTATPYIKHMIDFSFDTDTIFSNTKVICTYPLYDYLGEIEDKTIFGIEFKSNEIKVIKQIYRYQVIDKLEELFSKKITVIQNSNAFPKFYIWMRIYFEVCKQYKHRFLRGYIKSNIEPLEKKLENLNQYNIEDLKWNSLLSQFDTEEYNTEIKKREECYPKLLSKEFMMAKEKNKLMTVEEYNIKLNDKTIDKYITELSKLNAKIMLQEEMSRVQQLQNSTEYQGILEMQRLVMSIINDEGGRLWYDTRIKKYCFRSRYDGKIVEHNKKDITEILNRAIQKNLPKYHIDDTNTFSHIIEVELIETINDILKYKLKNELKSNDTVKVLIFTNQIPTIDDDVFDTTLNKEIFKSETDLLFKRNRFVPTKYLAKRAQYQGGIRGVEDYNFKQQVVQQALSNSKPEASFIQLFITKMVKGDKNKLNWIINWLAYYFQELKKTGTALVLLGDQEVTQNLLYKHIIEPIFGKRYCTIIDDNTEYQTAKIEEVAKDKLFIHIGDIDDAGTKFDDITLALLIKTLLIQESISFQNINDVEEQLIYSQVLITATNPAPYLKKSLSKCTVISVNNMDAIIEELELEDETELEDKIFKDLDNFSDLLNQHKVDHHLLTEKFITDEKAELKGETKANVNKEDRDSKVDDFIKAIKDKNLEYFEKIKGVTDNRNKDIYKQLENCFNKEDGYFVTNDLYLYFNAIYSNYNFKSNTKFLELLKEKDSMFKQQYLKLTLLNESGDNKVIFEKYSSEGLDIGSKNLLKINDYKLAEDFTISAGWFADKNDNLFEKYNYEDIESSKKARQIAKENGHIK